MNNDQLKEKAEKLVDILMDSLNLTTDASGRAISHIVNNLAVKPLKLIMQEIDDSISVVVRNFRENRKNNAIHKQYCDAFVAEHAFMVNYIINSEILEKDVLGKHIMRLTCLKAFSQFANDNDTQKIELVVTMLQQKVMPQLEHYK